MIVGIGTDLVSQQRIAAVLSRFGDRFMTRVLTPAECIAAQQSDSAETFLARRWAAKEAAAKALGVGIGAEANFHDIEILPALSGAPDLVFSGAAAATAARIGANRFHISITDERDTALAFVVLSQA